jgi:hypothetical protein
MEESDIIFVKRLGIGVNNNNNTARLQSPVILFLPSD